MRLYSKTYMYTTFPLNTDVWRTNDNQEAIRALELEIVPVFGNSNVELRESLLLDTHEENVSL